MAMIVDASVAFKWFVPEPDSDRALALFETPEPLYAPDLVLTEVSNAMWARLRKLDGDHGPVVKAAASALPRMLTFLVPVVELLPWAIELAFDLQHPIYDCVYLALAEREKAALITADRRLIATAGSGRHSALVKALA
jgi:predicted nucleic acid-binding protein